MSKKRRANPDNKQDIQQDYAIVKGWNGTSAWMSLLLVEIAFVQFATTRVVLIKMCVDVSNIWRMR